MLRHLPLFVIVTACGASTTAPPTPLVDSASASATSSSAPVATVTAPVGKARVDLTARKSMHFLGENVLVDFCVVNTSSGELTLSVGGDYRGGSRSARFKLEVTDANGNVMPDPDPHQRNFGGMGYSPKLAPGEKWCQSLPLMRYARIDQAGTYTVRAHHDLGWKHEPTPTGTLSISFAMPTAADAENVIKAMEALPDDVTGSAGKPSAPYPDFSMMRYEVYVAPLTMRAQKGIEHAIEGLAAIPTASATRALVALLSHSDQKIARAAAQGLAMRLPDPALTGALGLRNPFENQMSEQRKYLSAAAWVPSLADDVRAAARKRLAMTEVRDLQDGAFMLEAVGMPADGPDLVKALDAAIERTRTQAPETDVYPMPRGACMELLRAAEMLVARGLATPMSAQPKVGEIAVWLVAMSRGAHPQGWETQLDHAMRHTNAYVRELALDHAPDALPPSLLPAVKANLMNANEDVVVAAARLAQRAKLTSLTGDVVKAMAKPTGLRLNTVSYAAHELGARWDRTQALIRRLSEKAAFNEALAELVDLLAYQGRSSNGEVPEAERAALPARWAAFATKHRADIEADRKVALSDPSVTRDLVPSNWKLGRGDGTEWP